MVSFKLKNKKMKIIKFDIKKYPFNKMVANLYNYPLNELNDNMDKNNLYNNTKFTKENIGKDSDSIWHKIFYNKLREGWPEFMTLYKSFVGEVLGPLFNEEKELIYQKTPSFRVNQPNGKAVYIAHCDLANYKSIDLEFGEILMFYGNRLRHFNKTNDTGVTRCSFDFRVIPPVNYEHNYDLGSAIMKTKFLVGGYYDILNIDK
jgi:hypothetical protein